MSRDHPRRGPAVALIPPLLKSPSTLSIFWEPVRFHLQEIQKINNLTNDEKRLDLF